MSDSERNNQYSWDTISGAQTGPDAATAVEAYRLFQYAIHNILEFRFGSGATEEILRESGIMAGKTFYSKYGDRIADLNGLTRFLQEKYREMGIGEIKFDNTDQ